MNTFLKKGKPQSSKRVNKNSSVVREKESLNEASDMEDKDVSQDETTKSKVVSATMKKLSKKKDNSRKEDDASHHVKDAIVLLLEFEKMKVSATTKIEIDILEQAKKKLSLPVEIEKSLNIYRQTNKNLHSQDRYNAIDKINEIIKQIELTASRAKSLSAFKYLQSTFPSKGRVGSSDFSSFSKHVFVSYHCQTNLLEDFKKDLEYALERKAHLENSSENKKGGEKLKAFHKTFSSIQQLDRYIEKANAFQKEIDRASKMMTGHQCNEKLVDDLKRYVFLKIKGQNYRASLKLEGLNPSSDVALSTLESIRAKYVG